MYVCISSTYVEIYIYMCVYGDYVIRLIDFNSAGPFLFPWPCPSSSATQGRQKSASDGTTKKGSSGREVNIKYVSDVYVVYM